MLGHLQAAFNYEPINMRCAERGAAAWAAGPPTATSPSLCAKEDWILCRSFFISPPCWMGRYRTWAVDNFILPPLIECSTEMSVCDVPRSPAAVAGGDSPPKPPALGSCSLLEQSDLCGGRSPGQEDKGPGPKPRQALGKCLKTFCEAFLYAKPYAGKQGS